MSEYAWLWVCIAFIVIFVGWKIIAWIAATVQTGKAIHDAVKERAGRGQMNTLYNEFTAAPTVPPDQQATPDDQVK